MRRSARLVAGSFHHSDFAWQDWAAEARRELDALDRRGDAGAAADAAGEARGGGGGGVGEASGVAQGGPDGVAPRKFGPAPMPAAEAIAAASAAASAARGMEACWDSIHGQNSTAGRYPNKAYIPLAFPELARGDVRVVVEMGCATGGSLRPVLAANPALAEYWATDLSSAALEALRASGTLPEGRRVELLRWDATEPPPAELPAGRADAVLITFVLSAVAPGHHAACLRHAARLLRPGGLVLVRDHGLYDHTMLRFHRRGRRIADALYARGDGTTAFYLSPEGLLGAVEEAAAGLRAVDGPCYHCNLTTNRKTGHSIHRVFLHAKLRLEADGAGAAATGAGDTGGG